MPDFNSQKWFDGFRKIADKLCARANERRDFVMYNPKSFDSIKIIYENRLSGLKSEMFGDPQFYDRIDHHKIAALYIQVFLENPIFVVRGKQYDSFPGQDVMIINEMFCFSIMYAVLTDWDKKYLDMDNFGRNKYELIKLLYHYRKGHTDIDKRRPHFHFTYALAQIIYYIERNYVIDKK